MNIIKIAKSLFESTTGFKSRCVAYSYIVFTTLLFAIIFVVTALVVFGIVSNDHTVYIEAVKEIFIPIIKTSATFFGVAVGFTFGASAVSSKDQSQPQFKERTNE